MNFFNQRFIQLPGMTRIGNMASGAVYAEQRNAIFSQTPDYFCRPAYRAIVKPCVSRRESVFTAVTIQKDKSAKQTGPPQNQSLSQPASH